MGESATMAPNVAFNVIRTLFSAIDRPIYFVLGLMYRLFFNVASADIFANDTMMKFYSRVQLVLGVFMMFQLAVIILKGIMNPDSFTDSKTGIGNLITRVSIGLFLLVSLVPINIPNPSNEYEKQLNNNGLLFGTLYSLQNRLLTNNTLGRLILGTTDTTEYDYMSTNATSEKRLKTASNIFTTTILKGFYRINLLPEGELDNIPECSNAADPATINKCRMCQTGIDDYIEVYSQLDASPADIISMVNETCPYDSNIFYYVPIKPFQYLTGNTRYIFTYSPVISTAVGIVFIVILLSFTIDVAVRAVKLAILRLIAPIPIITYMDPKGSKDSAFNSWVKVLTSTYLDLFMRLAIVYFVIFLIQQMIVEGIVVNYGHGILGLFTFIILWIGLFIFAKQAPKFIRQVLGLKDENFKLFGGIKEAMALGSVAKGFVSGAVSGIAANAENFDPSKPYSSTAKTIFGGAKGFVGGGVNAAKKYYTDDKADYQSINKANRAYTQKTYSDASDGSTFLGRMKAGLQSDVGLKTDYQKMQDKIGRYERAENAWKGVQNALDSDDWKANNITDHQRRGGYVHGGTDFQASNGDTILSANGIYSLKDLKDKLDDMKTSGQYTADELSYMKSVIKDAEKSRFDYVRKQNKVDLETPREKQILEGANQIFEVAHIYSGDPDEVWKGFAGYSDQKSVPNGNMGPLFKGGAFAAGAEASQEKISSELAQKKAEDQRAEESKNK